MPSGGEAFRLQSFKVTGSHVACPAYAWSSTSFLPAIARPFDAGGAERADGSSMDTANEGVDALCLLYTACFLVDLDAYTRLANAAARKVE